ncbi:ISAs1 family transposase [Streptomyces sp. NBC_01217]|uniref:ISAs1 family transposase n=1 Tax=Streptomyces sp. NBC_01217 TaxID=2903779 RepID=UPI002E117526|nr:ISAs1 family transposase [Streptomyces sp. NBC_01217]
MSAVSSSPIPAVLAKLGPLNPDDTADLRIFLEAVSDPRSRRGRWYSLTSILLVCAAAAVSGARTIDELAEWGSRADAGLLASLGVRRHLLRWRHAPSRSAIGRVLERLDANALDAAVGAWLAHRHTARTAAVRDGRRVIAVDGKALRSSARLDQPRRHLLSAVTHGCPVTLAQAEVGSKTNETRHFQPLLAPLDLEGDVVTFDALHSVKANVAWLAETKKAHYVAVIKPNQPTAWAQLDGLDWHAVAIQHTASSKGHGRRESRSIKTLAIADNLGGIAFPHAKLALRVHRRRKETGRKETRETVYAVTSLDVHQAKPAELASHLRGHWTVEAQHHIRDRTFAEDASTVHAGNAPRVMATLRNLAIGALKALGATNIAKTTRAIRDQPERALPILGITYKPDLNGT